jgi:hypothetical protein
MRTTRTRVVGVIAPAAVTTVLAPSCGAPVAGTANVASPARAATPVAAARVAQLGFGPLGGVATCMPALCQTVTVKTLTSELPPAPAALPPIAAAASLDRGRPAPTRFTRCQRAPPAAHPPSRCQPPVPPAQLTASTPPPSLLVNHFWRIS